MVARLAQRFELVLANTAVSLLDQEGHVLWSGVSDDEGRVVASGIAGHVYEAVDEDGHPYKVTPTLLAVAPSDAVHVTLRFPLCTC